MRGVYMLSKSFNFNPDPRRDKILFNLSAPTKRFFRVDDHAGQWIVLFAPVWHQTDFFC
jgi:hypothetical protein